MTPNTTYDIRSYNFQPSDRLLFDANIWLFLYGPQSGRPDPQIPIYSRAASRAYQSKSQIFLDVLVLSEFINRYTRIEHQTKIKFHGAPENYKRFRQSNLYPSTALNVMRDVNRLLRHCVRIRSEFDRLNIDELMNEFVTTSADFNDLTLIRVCNVNNLILVTDDGDFREKGLTILTANPNLLRP